MRNFEGICYEATWQAGNKIKKLKRAQARIKADSHVGHHEIVSSADHQSQSTVLSVLRKLDPEAYFITEEHVKSPDLRSHLITTSTLDKVSKGRIYIVDELDGSSGYFTSHYEWSVSVGCVEKLRHLAGAVYAPEVFGGVIFTAQLGKGAKIKIGDSKPVKIKVANRKLRESYVLLGVDNFLTKYPAHNRLITAIGDKARTTNSNGSCALALSLVASGRADALIQPLESSWDWAAGKIILEEAGGTMIFYEIKRGKVMPVNMLQEKHYNPEQRTVGFIAAHKRLAQEILGILLK